jgi:hypothetical protein
VTTAGLKQQLAAITESLESDVAKSGRDGLMRLSAMFRSGVEVSTPYPAEMYDVDAMLERLYLELVSPVEEFRRASTQKNYERSLKGALSAAVKRLAPGLSVHEEGLRKLNGIAVNVGIRTTGPQIKALWRAVSLQAEDRPDDQIAKAKAAALDIVTIRAEISDLRHDRQFVALQPPKVRASERLKESIAWLEHQADGVFVVPSGDQMVATVEGALSTVLRHPRAGLKR